MAKDISRTLFIGLGGIGIETILRTKRLAYALFSIEEEIPSHLGFLGVDTDPQSFEGTVTGKNGECNLAPSERVLLHFGSDRLINYYESHKDRFSWFPKECLSSLSLPSPDMVRAKRRLLLSIQKEEVTRILQESLFKVISGASEYDCTEVHLVFSLAGGTGSGIFLDVAEMLQGIIEEYNIRAQLIAYAVLPEAFSGSVGGGAMRMWQNSYAALLEWDYRCTQGRSPLAPFYKVYFADQGISHHSVGDVSAALSQVLIGYSGKFGQATSSIDDCLTGYRLDGGFSVGDKEAWVYSLGVSSMFYDKESVLEYCSLKIRNGYLDLMLQAGDSDNAAESRLDSVWIQEVEYSRVFERLYGFFQPSPPMLDRKLFGRKITSDEVGDHLMRYFYQYDTDGEQWDNALESIFTPVRDSLRSRVSEYETKMAFGEAKVFLENVRERVTSVSSHLLEEGFAQHQLQLEKLKTDLSTCIDKLAGVNNPLFRPKLNSYLGNVNNAAFLYLSEKIKRRCEEQTLCFFRRLIGALDSEIDRISQIIFFLEEIRVDYYARMNRLQCLDRDPFSEKQIDEIRGRQLDLSLNDSFFSRLMPPIEHLDMQAFREGLEMLSFEDPLYILYKEHGLSSILEAYPREELSRFVGILYSQTEGYLSSSFEHNPMRKSIYKQFFISHPYLSDSPSWEGSRETAYYDLVEDSVDGISALRVVGPVPVFFLPSIEKMRMAYESSSSPEEFHTDAILYRKMRDEHFSLWPEAKPE